VVKTLRYLLIAAAACAGAITISALVNYWLDAQSPQTTPAFGEAAAKAPASVVASKRLDTRAIFERNLFGSETGAVEEDGQATSPAPAVTLALKGTADIEGRGFAVFTDSESGKQDIFATGEKIFDGPELVAVFPRSAVILLNGRHKTIEIEEADDKTPPEQADGKAAAAGATKLRIRKTGRNSYLVDRREVSNAIDNLNMVVTQVRAIPFMRDGKSLGFRVFAIKPGSIFEQMGLHNGDVVQRINDQPLTDPAKAAGLLDTIQTADALKVDVLRAGKPSSFRYRIQ